MKWLSGVEAPAANPEDLSLIPGDPRSGRRDLIPDSCLLRTACMHALPSPSDMDTKQINLKQGLPGL